MMRRFFIGAIVFAAAPVMAVDWADPPNPLRLPMPGGGTMEFVPVFLGAGDSLLSTVEFTAGTPNTTPEETPTIHTVGGSFIGQGPSGRDWFYYLGKTEVTQQQFNAVLENAGLPVYSFRINDPDLPATGMSWFAVQNFIRVYNTWLIAQQGILPRSEDRVTAFLRLPTESEWEFAARGGIAADRERFDLSTPYGSDPVEGFEWVAGPRSSHNKLNPAGRLKPNPLGLHDMLGNAAEMTASVFQLEPGQGPVGGLVRRGGNFRSRPEEVRSSIRGEYLPYDPEGKESGSPELGFRLMLGALVYSDVERVKEIRAGWDTYRASRIVPRPGRDRMAPSDALARGASDVLSADAITSDELARLQDQVRDIAAERSRYESRAVSTLVRWCSQNAHILAKNSFVLGGLSSEKLSDSWNRRMLAMQDRPGMSEDLAAQLGMIGETLTNFSENRRMTMERDRDHARGVYVEALDLLATMDPAVVREAMTAHIDYLETLPDAGSQAATTRVALQHLEEYLQNRQNAATRWTDELTNAYREAL